MQTCCPHASFILPWPWERTGLRKQGRKEQGRGQRGHTANSTKLLKGILCRQGSRCCMATVVQILSRVKCVVCSVVPERCTRCVCLTHQNSCDNVFCDNSQDDSKSEGPDEPNEVHDIGCPSIDLSNDRHTCTEFVSPLKH